MKRNAFILFLLLSTANLFAQKDSIKKEKVYKINYKIEIPISAANAGYSQLVYQRIGEKEMDPIEVANLSKSDVNSFDKVALNMDYKTLDDASTVSDIGVNIATALPIVLLLDKEIRQDWMDVVFLYAEAHSFNLLAYSVFGPNLVDRYRPICYYDELSIGERTKERFRNSFFSGHTSTTAVGSFFAAKIYSDYHPELGNKKYLLFGAACIPPAVVALYRVRAAKHYPSDVLTGFFVGASIGILTPHLHKIKKNKKLSLVPFTGSSTGLYFSYKF